MRKQSRSRRKYRSDYQTLENRMVLSSSLPAFQDSPALYQVYSNFGRVGQVDLESGTFETADFNAGTKVNAAGFRVADNFAYGIISSTHELARIGANGQIENLGEVEGLPQTGSYFVGDFASDGLLYVRGSNNNRGQLFGINVDSGKVERTIATSQTLLSIYDIAFNHVDEKFYASVRGPENSLISIDLQGNVETIGNNGISRITFGAMYSDASGNVYGGSNQDGGVYRFDLETGKATLVGRGPTSGVNDGFSNASLVLELPPLAQDDFFETNGLQSVSGNLFDNHGEGIDSDGNGDSISIVAVNGDNLTGEIVTLDSGSKISVQSDGSFDYRPSHIFEYLTVDQQRTDQFTYTVSDSSGLTSHANVTISVSGVQQVTEFKLMRVTGFDTFGGHKYVRVNPIGDVNGDGYEDGFAASHHANGGAGLTAVIYGSEGGFVKDFNVNALRRVNGGDGTLGSLFYGIKKNDLSGYRVAKLGDVNGDSIDDFAISAKDADPNGVFNAGETYVVFGNEGGFEAEFKLSQLRPENGGNGSRGFAIEGINRHDQSGGSLAGPGDFNGDGLNDIVLSSRFADIGTDRRNAGQVYVVFGSQEGFEATVGLGRLDDDRGVIFNGIRKHDLAGSEVTSGDINGDGLGDLVITARRADSFEFMVDVGQSYVIYGSENWQPQEFELASLLKENGGDSDRGIVIHGSQRFAGSGSYVEVVEDQNGDGRDDILVGSNDPNSLRTHLLHGGSEILDQEFELVELQDEIRVLLDNFDRAEKIYDDRDWDRYNYSVTLHSDFGSQVTIWGDPHVVIRMDGLVRRFDIGLGPQEVRLKSGTVVSWDTVEPDWQRYPKGPPLSFFKIDSAESKLDHSVDLDDRVNFTDRQTALSEADLRELARALYAIKI